MSPDFSYVLQKLQRDLEVDARKALVETRATSWDDYLRRFHIVEGRYRMLEAIRTEARRADDDDYDEESHE